MPVTGVLLWQLYSVQQRSTRAVASCPHSGSRGRASYTHTRAYPGTQGSVAVCGILHKLEGVEAVPSTPNRSTPAQLVSLSARCLWAGRVVLVSCTLRVAAGPQAPSRSEGRPLVSVSRVLEGSPPRCTDAQPEGLSEYSNFEVW